MRDELPAGFLYRPDVLAAAEEAALVPHVQAFDFSAVEMRGQIARQTD